jgi:hypothetical protein
VSVSGRRLLQQTSSISYQLLGQGLRPFSDTLLKECDSCGLGDPVISG